MRILAWLSLGLLGVVRIGWAGIPDTPLPTFSDGKPAMLAYTLPAVVKNNAVESVVICTSLAAEAIDLGLEVFDRDGTPANAVAAGNGAALGVLPGATVTLATGATALFHEDGLLAVEPPVTTLANGSGRVVATNPLLACVAFAVDSLHAIADPAVCPACKAPQLTSLLLLSPCTQDACDDGNVCTSDACSESGGCVHSPTGDGTACDDGDACTTPDACLAGVCRGTAVTCGADTPCHQGAVCQPATGQCVTADPFSTCTPGGGGRKTDCVAEWVVDNPGNAKGLRSSAQTCRQGDITCDYDADPAQCTFHVRACLGNQDVELPSCSPMAVATYQLRHPTSGAKRPSDGVAAQAIVDAIAALGPSTVTGKQANKISFEPALAAGDRCTAVLAVPLPAGKSLALRSVVAPSAGAKDKDRLKLKCIRP